MILLSEGKEILEPEEVADLLRVNPQTVKRLASRKEIPGFKVGGQWRFRRIDIEAFITKQVEQEPEQKKGDA